MTSTVKLDLQRLSELADALLREPAEGVALECTDREMETVIKKLNTVRAHLRLAQMATLVRMPVTVRVDTRPVDGADVIDVSIQTSPTGWADIPGDCALGDDDFCVPRDDDGPSQGTLVLRKLAPFFHGFPDDPNAFANDLMESNLPIHDLMDRLDNFRDTADAYFRLTSIERFSITPALLPQPTASAAECTLSMP